MFPLFHQSQRAMMRGFTVLVLVAGVQLAFLLHPAMVSAATCAGGSQHCYGRADWYGTPGTFSGGATSIWVPTMTYNDPGGVLTNEMWIANFTAGSAWVEGGAWVGHSFAGSLQGEQIYFAAQLNTLGQWSQINFGPVPAGDINQWANLYVFQATPNQWSVVIESLSRGSLATPSATPNTVWLPNDMQAEYQQIGEEQGNDWSTTNDAYSDLAYWTNNRYRDLNAQYWPQTVNPPTVVNWPISAGWLVTPANSGGNGGTWWARLP